MDFGDVIKTLREQKGITQKQMSEILGVSKSNISKYEAMTIEPNIDTLKRYANYFHVSLDFLLGREDKERHGLNDDDIDKYGLDGSGISHLLTFPNEEEKAIKFSHKLAIQFDFSGAKLADVASSIGVTDEIIWEWLTEKRDDYYKYYDKLSTYFNVDPTYWTRPGAISPGIESTSQEYFLLLKYRFQGQIYETSLPPIEDFFPNCHELSKLELKWLNSFRCLNEDNQDIIMGKIKEFIKEQRLESVAADDKLLKKTGTESMGK